MEFLMRIPLMHWLFGRRTTVDESRHAARARLKNALVGDRSSVAPSFSQALQKELLEVLTRYMEVDGSTLEVKLETTGETMHWTAGVQVARVHRQAHLPTEAMAEPRNRQGRTRPKRTLRGSRWRRSQEETPSQESEKSA